MPIYFASSGHSSFLLYNDCSQRAIWLSNSSLALIRAIQQGSNVMNTKSVSSSPNYSELDCIEMEQSAGDSQIEEQFPKDREQYPLKTVGQDSGLEATSEEAEEAFSLYDDLCGLGCNFGKVLVSKTST